MLLACASKEGGNWPRCSEGAGIGCGAFGKIGSCHRAMREKGP